MTVAEFESYALNIVLTIFMLWMVAIIWKLGKDSGGGRWAYIALAEDLRRVSAEPRQDARELFRRMSFNALISNTDDHPRNHALIARAKDWRLSPAYDLAPDTPISLDRRDLALDCGDYGRYANAENLLSQSPRFHLERSDAEATIMAMEAQVRATWYQTARRAGVTERDCARIAGAFAYPGFRLTPGRE